ncbi:MAG TPA: alpha/beta hydrolase, partial [Polyangia bacterium]
HTGTPLVVLSPLGSSMDDWDPAITNGLARKQKVILFDNQGVGLSTGKTPDSIAAMASGAVSFIKALGHTKVNLMGFSMGGFISQQIALTEPALVNKIILTGTGPKGSVGLGDLPKILASATSDNPSPEELFLRFGFTQSEASRRAGKAAYQRVNARVIDRDKPVSNESVSAGVAAVLGWAQANPNALAELKLMTQPTLIIQGQKDVPVPVINAINLSQNIPNARLVLFPDAAHAALFQFPAQFVQHVLDFLDPAAAEAVLPAGEHHQKAATQFVEAGDTKYAYRILGDKTGIPLVILSPLGSSMDDWDPAITNGLASKHKVILFDNQGIGSTNGTTPATIAGMASGAVSFIKALGLSKVNLMGFSMGGFISQQIALTEPALVNKIILTGAGPKGSVGLADLPKNVAALLGANLSPEELFLRSGFTDSDDSRRAGKAAYQRIQTRTVDRDKPATGEAVTAGVMAVVGWAQPSPDALKELGTLSQPTLIFHGQKDAPVPVVNAINLSQSIPHARLVLMADAAHAVSFQFPAQFVQSALDFLNE